MAYNILALLTLFSVILIAYLGYRCETGKGIGQKLDEPLIPTTKPTIERMNGLMRRTDRGG